MRISPNHPRRRRVPSANVLPTNHRRLLPTLVLIGMLCYTLPAAAQCSVSATSVNFGDYDPFAGTAVDSTGTVTVSCTVTLGYDIALSQGNAGSFNPRVMSSGGNTLNYNLFTDVARSTIWGDGSGGTATVTGSIGTLLAPTDHIVYGRIPGSQNPSVGSYTDTITVTVTF